MSELADMFRRPELAWLIERLAARLRQGKPLDCGAVTLREAGPDERRAVDDLLGRRSTRGRQLTVDLARLCERIHADAKRLEAIVAAVHGPVENLRAAREAAAAAWEAVHSRWRERLADHPAATRWFEGLVSGGLLKRLASGEPGMAGSLLDQAWRILSGIPHDEILLANLAARITGDSHALDRGRPLSTLCLRALAEIAGIDGTAGAGRRREAWAAAGVVVDDLSAPVLCLNLRAAAGNDLAPVLDWHLARGEPFYLPWRQVRRFAPDSAMAAVYVCENPALVSEAANRLGAQSQPLVCLNGIPGTPARFLLRRLLEHGVVLHLRADFDWTGLRIIDRLRRPGLTRLWRMTAVDYHACRPIQPLTGAPVTPSWGAELAAAMRASGLAAYEEELTDRLLADLQRPAPRTPSPRQHSNWRECR